MATLGALTPGVCVQLGWSNKTVVTTEAGHHAAWGLGHRGSGGQTDKSPYVPPQEQPVLVEARIPS